MEPVLCKFNGYFDHLHIDDDSESGRLYCDKGTLATGFMYNTKGRLVPFCESCYKSFVETLDEGTRKYKERHPYQGLHELMLHGKRRIGPSTNSTRNCWPSTTPSRRRRSSQQRKKSVPRLLPL